MSVNDVIEDNLLPRWMAQAKRGIDWGAIIVIAFCAIAAWSYLDGTTFSATTANEAYIFRMTDYAEAFTQGRFYPRWSPHALSTYGAPIPHFYPSGASYIGGLITFLFTNDAILTLRILYTLSLIIGGSTIYTFVAQRSTSFAGLIAAIVYIFNPVMLLSTGHLSGNLPLAIGAALLPCLLWAVNRLLLRYQPIDTVLVTLITALLIFTIPVVALFAVLAILVLLVIEFRQQIDWTKLLLLAIALLAGVLASAFYWFPALRHASQINWHLPLVDAIPVHITWSQLLQMNHSIPTSSARLYPMVMLGWGIIAGVCVNVIYQLLVPDKDWFSIAYSILGCVTAIFLVYFVPEQPSWLLLIFFCFAIGTSGIGTSKSPAITSKQLVMGSSIIILNLLLSIPTWIIPESQFPLNIPTPQDQIDYERLGYGYAGLPAGQRLPSHLSPEDAYDNPYITSYDERTSRLIDRNPLPLISESPYGGSYSLSPQDTNLLTYNRAYFELWNARLSNNMRTVLNIEKSPDQLISITIPDEIEGILNTSLRPDTITILAGILSLTGVISCLGLAFYIWQDGETTYDESVLLRGSSLRVVFSLLVLFSFARSTPFVFDEQYEAIWPESDAVNLLQEPLTFQNLLDLTGVGLSRQTYRAGGHVTISTLWELPTPSNFIYLVQVRLVDPIDNTTTFESGFTHLSYFPTTRWIPDTPVEHQFSFDLPPAIDSGTYTVMLDLFLCDVPCFNRTIASDRANGRFMLPISLIIID